MASTMRFDKWETPLGTLAAQVDSSGRISQPGKPIISGQIGSTGTFAGPQKIPFDDFWVQRGITYDAPTRRFTVPISGIYRITMNPFTNPAGASVRVMIGVNQDAPTAVSHRGMCYKQAVDHNTLSLNSVVSLNAGDFIVYYVDTGQIYNGSGDRFNQFSIEMIA